MNEYSCHFIIAGGHEEPVAFASYAQHPADNKTDNSIWKLHKIYILPSKQAKGTGRFIINYIAENVRKKGATALQLQVNRINKTTDFYKNPRFRIIKTADFVFGNGYFMNDQVMELAV